MSDLFNVLTDENFTLFAAKCYNNPQCTELSEFYDDLNRFKYLKRLLKRYDEHDDLQHRLILNHIIVIYNVFGIPAANKMMKFKMDKQFWPAVKTFLVYLHYLPETEMLSTPLDPTIVNVLRKL